MDNILKKGKKPYLDIKCNDQKREYAQIATIYKAKIFLTRRLFLEIQELSQFLKEW
jgi:hypothetical protein